MTFTAKDVAALRNGSAYICGEFETMRGFNQNNPHHCYDLLEHTLHTVEGILQQAPSLSDDEADDLFVSALFHDIGKPDVVKEKNERSVFYGHAARSAKIAEEILKKPFFEKISSERKERILFLIKEHDTFIPFFAEGCEQRNAAQQLVCKETVMATVKKETEHLQKKEGITPSLHDWWLLTFLIWADVNAQSEIAIIDDKISGTKVEKSAVALAVRDILAAEL